MGGKSQTTTQSATNTPTGMPQLYDIWNRVQQAASTPYTPYGGQMVAGLSPTQQAGISGVTNAQGAAQPYFDQAADYAKTGASTIDPSSVQKYMSPYTQNVIDATRKNFDQDNAIQQNQVVGNAAARGALGGDRAGVAAAETARQQRLVQDPIIAGMYSQAYDKALGAAQQDRSAAAQGAYTFGALAPSVQNAKISGAQAQIGAGGLEQGTEQSRLTAAYNQYLQQLAFPYQQAGFLASAGLPAVTNLGGQTNGSTTKPGPSPWGQIAGLGLTAASFIKRGGRIKARRYADGGPVNFIDVPSYVPRFGGVSLQSPFGSAPALPKIPDDVKSDMPSNQQIAGGMKGLKSLFGGMGGAEEGGNYESGLTMAIPSSLTGMVGGGVKRGGRINPRMARFHDTVHAIRQTLRSGGAVRGYAGGGDVIDLSPNDYVRHGFDDTRQAIDNGDFDPQGANAPGAMAFGAPSAPSIPLPRPRPDDAPQGPYGLPPQIAQGPDAEALPDDAMAFDRPQRAPYALPAPASAGAAAPPPDAPAKPGGGLFGNPFGISDDARMGLRSAGLGMLASQSPFALSAIGEGGLQGMKTYSDRLNHRQTVESEARKLAQQASQFAQNLGLHKDQLAETVKDREQRLLETRRQHDLTERRARIPAGYREADDGSLEVIPGGPQDPKTIETQAKAKKVGNGLLDEDTISDMAGQYLAGDKSVMQNLGRGAQGAENIVKLRGEITKQAREAGLKPDQIATKMADFAGRTAAMRSLGTRGANVEYAANTANRAIDLAEQASDKVPRTQFVPFNQLKQLVETKTSSPEQAAFYAATNTLVNEYARVASGGSNQATEGMRHHAREMLNTAQGPGAYKAVLNMMRREIASAKAAYTETRKEFLADHSEAKPESAPALGGEVAPKIGERKQFKQGWGKWDGTTWVPEKP